ncbi:MAG: adenylate/guanylate cyclase domain-containing protein [bacterium]|nr:adenylate/guanylate cyclase domain-containing protein [bacterium]
MKRQRHLGRPIIVAGIVGMATAVLFAFGVFVSWSERATDRFFLPETPDPSILIVAIDDASIAQIGRWPWARSVHADLISKLSSAKVIAYDVTFAEPSDPVDDAQLESAIEHAGNVVLPIELRLRAEKSRMIFYPSESVRALPELSAAALQIGHTNTPPDDDGVVRRIPLLTVGPDGTEIPAFAVRAYEAVGGTVSITQIPVDSFDRLRVHFGGAPGSRFQTISAIDVLQGKISSDFLAGRTVFVGATASDLHDSQLVPTSNGVPMPGIEIHASLFDTLLRRAWIASLPIPVMMILLICIAVLLGGILPFVRARFSIPLVVLIWLSALVGSALAFSKGKIIDVVWTTFTIIFVYTVVMLERRVTADRERTATRMAFSRYVSESVVTQILDHPEALKLGGEKREMTVLFSDLRGFTSLSESIPADQLVETLNTYLTRMTQIVFDHDGVLDKYIGDAVMAFWNAPFDQNDHAERAVRTAIVMRDALEKMNSEKIFPKGVELKMGIGINTGEMVVGNFGGETRFDYTVIGDAVNLGARIESATKEHSAEILISESTYERTAGMIRARRVGEVMVKGKAEPVVLYKVFGLK